MRLGKLVAPIALPFLWPIAVLVVVAVIVLALYWGIRRRAPSGDRRFTLKADPLPPECRGPELYRTARVTEKVFDPVAKNSGTLSKITENVRGPVP